MWCASCWRRPDTRHCFDVSATVKPMDLYIVGRELAIGLVRMARAARWQADLL